MQFNNSETEEVTKYWVCIYTYDWFKYTYRNTIEEAEAEANKLIESGNTVFDKGQYKIIKEITVTTTSNEILLEVPDIRFKAIEYIKDCLKRVDEGIRHKNKTDDYYINPIGSGNSWSNHYIHMIDEKGVYCEDRSNLSAKNKPHEFINWAGLNQKDLQYIANGFHNIS